ncbi:MAG: UDP-N-acetylmuramoyl-L-alanine--D-glutamate ligase [Candidatus Melainabacteria bacterium]|nr:UDP-N-acetylmuramoyl-L-alanine--D-glutamate ligase [Candidatus Melainabacteria bacterium]
MVRWKQRKVTIYGLGRSGLAAARYLSERGADVYVSDSQPESKVADATIQELKSLGVKYEFGEHSLQAIRFADIFVVSPGISPYSDVIQMSRKTGKEVISDIELASRMADIPIIAITGTNGKSTTTALTSHLLEACGFRAPVCGNIGVPILSLLDEKHDFLVAEVSSFQLEYSPTFAPFISVWLNLTPDHIDWHKGIDNYVDAKRRMFKNQQMNQYAVLSMDDVVVAATSTMAEVFPFSTEQSFDEYIQGTYVSDGFVCCRRSMTDRVVMAVSELPIKGQHNVENVLAAVGATVLAGGDIDRIKEGLKTFKNLEHRMEYVGTIDGVAFYNDSKATNTVSAIKALESFPGEPVVLIAGGKDKGTSLTEFVHVVRKTASAVILIGEATARFENELRQGGVQNIYPVASLDAAVKLGAQLNQGPVLLSPACASFDMFKDYEERGRVFKDIVRARLKEVAQKT